MPTFFETLNDLVASKTPVVAVTVVDTMGSVPQDVGAKMLVTEKGLHTGTVGGGKVETRAIAEAQRMLREGASTFFANWSLNKDIGMTCGGSVKMYFEAFNVNSWTVVIFGAGHVANALARLLTPMDCEVLCIDPRPEWLAKIPDAPNLRKIETPDMPQQVAWLPGHAFVVLMTMGHTTDKPILLEILRTRQFPYIGVIGSNAKAKQLKKDIVEAGLPDVLQQAFFCPIGLDVGSNHPQEIAISVAAQLIQERDRVRGGRAPHRENAVLEELNS